MLAPTRRSRPRTWFVPALGLLVLAATASPANAHARLLSSEPAGGDTLEVPPAEVTLTFSEQIEQEFAQVQVTDPSGERVDAAAPIVDGDTVEVDLQPLEEPGAYNVAFRVISADGHPIEAAYVFDLATPPESSTDPPPPPAEDDELPDDELPDDETPSSQPDDNAPPSPPSSDDDPSGAADAEDTDEPAVATDTASDGTSVLLPVALIAAAAVGGLVLARRRRATANREASP